MQVSATQWLERFAEKPFKPRWGLAGPHQQTLLGYYWRRRFFISCPVIDRVLFPLSDGSRMMAECCWQAEPAAHPTLLAIHGMEGSSRSGYMLGLADKAFHAGFNTLRLNLRNCCGTERLTPKLYHAGQSDDMREVVETLISRYNLSQIVLAGFSLGGNICLKLAAEWGAEVPKQVVGVGVVSPLVDLTRSWRLLEKPSNILYRRRFVLDLKNRIRVKARLFPELYDLAALDGIRTIREFDRRYTAPHHGFRDVEDYYTRASSAPLLGHIRIPTLAIHAASDPLLPLEPLERQNVRENAWIITLLPKSGGHVGFVGDPPQGDFDERWSENRLLQFFRLLQPQISADEERRCRPIP